MNFFKDFFSDYGKKIGGSFVGGFLGFGKSGNDNMSKYNTSVGYTGGANYEKLSNLSPKGMGVPTSRFQFLKDIRDFSTKLKELDIKNMAQQEVERSNKADESIKRDELKLKADSERIKANTENKKMASAERISKNKPKQS